MLLRSTEIKPLFEDLPFGKRCMRIKLWVGDNGVGGDLSEKKSKYKSKLIKFIFTRDDRVVGERGDKRF